METGAKDISYVRIDRTREIPLTALVRALGFDLDDIVSEIFGDSGSLRNTIGRDLHKNTSNSRTEEGLEDIYGRLRPDEPETADNSRSLLVARFSDLKCYDLANVGHHEVNKKLDLKTRLLNLTLAEMSAGPKTGEIAIEEGTVLTHQIVEILGEYIDNGLNSATYCPSEDVIVTEPITI